MSITFKERTVFYRAGFKDKSNVDDAIQFWGKMTNWDVPKELSCAHVEYLRNCDAGYFVDRCITSTMRHGGQGVTIRPADMVLMHPERWFYTEYEFTMKHGDAFMLRRRVWERLLWEWEHNQGYDKRCIISFFWPFGRFHSLDKWICSEIVTAIMMEYCEYNEVLNKVFGEYVQNAERRDPDSLMQPPVWSPMRLAGKLYEAGAVFKELKDDSIIRIKK